MLTVHHYIPVTIIIQFIHKTYRYMCTCWILYYCHRTTWVMGRAQWSLFQWVIGSWVNVNDPLPALKWTNLYQVSHWLYTSLFTITGKK